MLTLIAAQVRCAGPIHERQTFYEADGDARSSWYFTDFILRGSNSSLRARLVVNPGTIYASFVVPLSCQSAR